MKIKRKFLGEVLRSAYDGMIAQNFLSAYENFDSFFIYNSFNYEASTREIIRELVAAGKDVYLPRVENGEICAVPYGETRRGAFGIEEPMGDVQNIVPEVTIAPLLAVNGRGYRLGYGGGYYDRYFKNNPTLKVGIGYDFQMAEFEEEPFDVGLDVFISERGMYTFGREK